MVYRNPDDNEQEEMVLVPLWLKLIDKSFSREGDSQSVSVLEDGSTKIERAVLLYKPIDQVLTSGGSVPKMFEKLLTKASDYPNGDKYKYAIMQLTFELKIRMNTDPQLYLAGAVSVVGMSTGSHDDKNRMTFFVDNISEEPAFPIAGYNFTLYRGLLRDETSALQSAVNVEQPSVSIVVQLVEEVFVNENTEVEVEAVVVEIEPGSETDQAAPVEITEQDESAPTERVEHTN